MIKAIFAVFLILPAVVSAENLDSLDAIRNAVFRLNNVKDAGNAQAPDSVANQFINIAAVQVCKDFPANPKEDTIIATSAAKSYAVNSDFMRRRWCIKYSGDTLIPLEDTSVQNAYMARGGPEGFAVKFDRAELPRFYWIHNKRIWFYPAVALADTFVLAYYASPNEMTAAADTTEIDDEYRMAVVLYASHLMNLRVKNYTAASELWLFYKELVAMDRQYRMDGLLNQ